MRLQSIKNATRHTHPGIICDNTSVGVTNFPIGGYLIACKLPRLAKDYVNIRSEWAESGESPQQLVKILREISAEMEAPKILLPPD